MNPNLTEALVCTDFEDAYAEVIVIQQANMACDDTKTMKVSYKLKDENGDITWVTKIILKNTDCKTIAIIVENPSVTTPTWIGATLISQINILLS